MKGFTRKEPLFSLCGLKCGLCVMHLGGYCPGCGGGEGNQSCAIARCSMQHGNVQYCFACDAYPCASYAGTDAYDSFIPSRDRQKDFDRAQQMGLDAYLNELHAKMDILQELLAHYNDGRRKTFFATAVYRLDFADLQAVMEALQAPQVQELAVKERAQTAVRRLQEVAEKRKIDLKLRKKPKA